MAIITDGTISLTQNSNIVTGIGTLFLTKGVVAGDLLKRDSETVPYIIAADATSETSLTLLTPYALPSVSGATFQVTTDFFDFQIPKIYPEMRDSYYFINEGLRIIAEQLGLVGASAYHAQVLTKPFIGIPLQGAFFGYQKFTGAAQLNKIIIASQTGEVTDNDLVLDIEINGSLQGLNLTVPAGSSTVTSSALSYIVNAGEVVRLKWITVTEPCASNWDVDINYQNSSGLVVYYDFQKMVVGNIYNGLVIGASYLPPHRNKVFGMSYQLAEIAEGSGIILELLQNGASLGTPVTVTIPEGSLGGYLDISQTEFTTTQTCSLRVNQAGTTIPGNTLNTVLHSYHTTA